MPSLSNKAIVAAAGSGKTASIVDQAVGITGGRVLIVTFTNENQRQIISRIEQLMGVMPKHMAVVGWFSFLINQGIRPYQSAATGKIGQIGTLNFIGSHFKFAKRENLNYYLDRSNNLFRDGVSDFACVVNKKSEGRAIKRLESIYSHIFIDEFQDLAGYDLDFIDLLLQSSIEVTMVGDPRQHTFSTNLSPRNKRYRGAGFVDWLSERELICYTEVRDHSFRCNQEICDFADSLFPNLPRTTSLNSDEVEHKGVFIISRDDVAEYVEHWNPVILRENKSFDTCGLPAINIGIAKGSTFDRVLIFATKPMLSFVKTRDLTKLKTNDRLYVAVTRARHSATFVDSS